MHERCVSKFFEVWKQTLCGMRERTQNPGGMLSVVYGMKISLPVHVQNEIVSTRKWGMYLIISCGMRDERLQIRPTK